LSFLFSLTSPPYQAVAKANAEAAAVLKAKPASQKDLEEANAAVVAALATKAAFKSEMATPLPGLNFNDDKLFFVSFARLWCGANTLETAENRALTDPHSPGRYRTIGPLSNDVNFAKAFQCKKGDKMVSEKPCVVW
jgi:predicted metalloendopeptidase